MNRLSSPCLITDEQLQHEPIYLRTDTDGTLRVPNDWLHTFNEAAKRFDTLYLQTRHAYTRLVAQITPTKLKWNEKEQTAVSADKRLIIRPHASASIHSRVETCNCCGCPGRLEFRNQFGHEFLQVCSPRELPASEWALFVQALVANKTVAPNYDDNGIFPKIPGNAKELPFHPSMLATILNLLCEQEAGIDATLVTKETIHSREIFSSYVEFDEEMLGVYSSTSSLQLALAAVRCLHLTRRPDGEVTLLATGPDNAQLLAIKAAKDRHSQESLEQVLQDLVPGL